MHCKGHVSTGGCMLNAVLGHPFYRSMRRGRELVKGCSITERGCGNIKNDKKHSFPCVIVKMQERTPTTANMVEGKVNKQASTKLV